jgi:hypothetical protein
VEKIILVGGEFFWEIMNSTCWESFLKVIGEASGIWFFWMAKFKFLKNSFFVEVGLRYDLDWIEYR